MADLSYLFGENRRIQHQITRDTAFTVSDAFITIYRSDGVVTTGPSAATIDNPNPAKSHTVYYPWQPAAVGAYVYALSATINGETTIDRGSITVRPLTSRLDRWLERVRRTVAEPIGDNGTPLLSLEEYVECIQAAVREYSRSRPRMVETTADSDIRAPSGTPWLLPLPTDWTNGFSGLYELYYPVMDSQPYKNVLTLYDYELDPLAGFVRLGFVPAVGDPIRMVYSTLHTVDENTDTVPDEDIESVAQYAAGLALLRLAAKAQQPDLPLVSAETVGLRAKAPDQQAQAQKLMELAMREWRSFRWIV